MSITLDARVTESGTRFRIFPQPRFLTAFSEPETISVSVPPDQIEAGPADDRMFVVDAIDKQPYDRFTGPPFLGSRHSPVVAGADGHFDHLDLDGRAFSSATMYATVRRVLDIWQDYFGRRIEWHFRTELDRLELIPLIVWDNAQSGFGFLEFGFGRTPFGGVDPNRPYCQNFDVLAHELGHSLIFAEVGLPFTSTVTDEYGGFHESAADMVAILSSLHFRTVVDHLLTHSKGNLFTVNELSRVGELSDSRQIRHAFNDTRMSTVSRQPHDLSLPLTGAVFDVMVEVFQDELVAAGLITRDLADRSFHAPDSPADDQAIQAAFAEAYAGKETAFRDALLRARDYLGLLLARTWTALGPHNLRYTDVGREMIDADRAMSGGQHATKIRECFAWRQISVERGGFMLAPRRLSDCGLR